MDYLEMKDAKPLIIGRFGRRSTGGIKPRRKIDKTPRFCECGHKMSVYNTNAKCFACETRRKNKVA